jgi:excinuclease UvrABC helicase subunit UvrB
MPINSGTGNPKPRTGGGIYSSNGKNVNKIYKPQDTVANAQKTEQTKAQKERQKQAEYNWNNEVKAMRVKKNIEKQLGTYNPNK